MKKQIRLYLDLIRFDKPIGTILLTWPCLWGITHGYHVNGTSLHACAEWGVILTIGAFLTRSLGCIMNDIADRKLDAQVDRTKNRPLAAHALSLKQAMMCAAVFSAASLAVFMILPNRAKPYAVVGAVLLFIYPYMKRVTYYPQIVLGLAFSLGVPVGYACVAGVPTVAVWALYGCGVVWTIAYDTIYAFQDIKDDLKIGVKSTAIRFNKFPKVMVGVCYILGLFFLYSAKGVGASTGLYSICALYVLITWKPNEVQSSFSLFKAHRFLAAFGLFR